MKSRSITDGKNDATVRVNRGRIKDKLCALGLIGVLDEKVWKVP